MAIIDETDAVHPDLIPSAARSEVHVIDEESARRMPLGPVFPTEIFEHTIDHSWFNLESDQNFSTPDYRTLLAYALTCRAWLPRSRYHIFYTIRLETKAQRTAFSKLLAMQPHLDALVHELRMVYHPKPHLRTVQISFPTALAGNLTTVSRLTLQNFDKVVRMFWETPSATLLALSAMSSIVELHLAYIGFVTTGDCTRLISRLPNLRTLRCTGVHLGRHGWAERHLKAKLHTLVMNDCVYERFPSVWECEWLVHVTNSNLGRFQHSCWRKGDTVDPTSMTALQSLALFLPICSRMALILLYEALQEATSALNLRTLALAFTAFDHTDFNYQDEAWARIDEVLTRSFAHVETITLYIFFYDFGRLGTWPIQPELALPRMCRQRAVSMRIMDSLRDVEGSEELQDFLYSNCWPDLRSRSYKFSK